MIVMPVRLVETREDGILCRLGSSPKEDAPKEWIPKEFLVKSTMADESDLAVLVFDEGNLPECIKKLTKVS